MGKVPTLEALRSTPGQRTRDSRQDQSEPGGIPTLAHTGR